MSTSNGVPTPGLLWVQGLRDLDKIWWNGSHFKMTCHWDTYLTLYSSIVTFLSHCTLLTDVHILFVTYQTTYPWVWPTMGLLELGYELPRGAAPVLLWEWVCPTTFLSQDLVELERHLWDVCLALEGVDNIAVYMALACHMQSTL